MSHYPLTRRSVLKASLAAAVALHQSAPKVIAGATGKRRPNILMIIADDMNDYGFYETYPDIQMPYLRQFMRTAVTFDKAYCAAPACIPSRAAVFSGLYPHNTGVYLNDCDPWRKPPLNGIEAMPECFKRNGYTTFGRGKLFHSEPEPERKKGHVGQRGVEWGVRAVSDREEPIDG